MLRCNINYTVILMQIQLISCFSNTDFSMQLFVMDNISNPFLHTFRLPIKPSPKLCRIVILMHILCLIMIWLNSLTLIIKVVISCFISISFCVFFYRRALNKTVATIDSLILDYEDTWQVKMLDGTV